MSYKCPLCDKVFETFMGLKMHYVHSHKSDDMCPLCNKRFVRIASHLSSASKTDYTHKLIYGLYGTKFTKHKEWYKSCRAFAMTELKVRENDSSK